MEKYSGYADMLLQYEQKGWQKIKTGRGFDYIPPDTFGNGILQVSGDASTYCFMDSKITLNTDLLERHYNSNKTIQISFLDDVDMSYYQKKNEASTPAEGLFCFVNNIPRVYFQHYYAGTKLYATTIAFSEEFIHTQGITFPNYAWDRLASVFNSQKVFIPEISVLCKEIKSSQIADDFFDIYLKGKIIEMIGLLLSQMVKLEHPNNSRLHGKSYQATQKALEILNNNFTNPPIVEDLAQMVGVNKMTLQKAFHQCVGQSIYDYCVSLRMEKALSLMENDQLSIEKISKIVGYQSKINFYKAFQKVYHCKPAELRKYIR